MIENIHIQKNPELEWKIFERYNRGENSLIGQEIYITVYKKSYKCQVSILIILTLVYKYIKKMNIDYKIDKYSTIIFDSIKYVFLMVTLKK